MTVSGSRATSTEFADALARVAGGGTALDPEVVGQLFRSSRHSRGVAALTPRERDVMALMAEGRSNAGIAGAPLVSARVAESTWPASSTSWHCLRGRQPPGTRRAALPSGRSSAESVTTASAIPPVMPGRCPPRGAATYANAAKRDPACANTGTISAHTGGLGDCRRRRDQRFVHAGRFLPVECLPRALSGQRCHPPVPAARTRVAA